MWPAATIGPMAAFAADPFGVQPTREVEVEMYTTAYRVTGRLPTRFERVADILNQATATHLSLSQATLAEHAAGGLVSTPQLLVSVDEILVMVARGTAPTGSSDMRVAKRPVRAQLGIPPFRLVGTIHVPQGSRPIDGLLNAVDRFLPMTDATIAGPVGRPAAGDAEGSEPGTIEALAFRRDRAHVVLVADDERPDELLADVLNQTTAEAWLRTGRGESAEPTGSG